MPSDPIIGIRSKINRAEDLSGELAQAIDSFFRQPDLFRLVVEDVDRQSDDRWVKIQLAKPLPDNLSLLAAEIVYHLRSGLDQLTVALALANGKTASGVYFPFAGDMKDFESRGSQDKIKKLSPAVIEMIRVLKPYQGGDDLLWGLGRLANVDKHNMLLPVGTVATTRLFQGMSIQNARVGIKIPQANSRLDEGIKFCNLGPDGTISFGGSGPNIKVEGGNVVFGDVDVFRGKPVISTFDRLGPLVFDILNAFEPHCRRRATLNEQAACSSRDPFTRSGPTSRRISRAKPQRSFGRFASSG